MKIQPNLLKNEIEFIKPEQFTKRMILSQINRPTWSANTIYNSFKNVNE